jgi:hypothetical protein
MESGPLRHMLVLAGTRSASPWCHEQAQFLRLRARRGAKKAILAVAASMLNAAWRRLKDRVEYKISAPTTSLAAIAPRRSGAWSDDSMTSAARSNSLPRLPE